MLFFSSQLTGNMTQVPGAMHLTEPSGLPDNVNLKNYLSFCYISENFRMTNSYKHLPSNQLNGSLLQINFGDTPQR